jgi:hypothetical protein
MCYHTANSVFKQYLEENCLASGNKRNPGNRFVKNYFKMIIIMYRTGPQILREKRKEPKD